MKYKVVSVILGCAVLFATLGTPAGAAPIPRQRSFSASFQFTSQALVSDATCVGGQAVVIKGSFVRAGRPGWVFDSQTCLDGTSGSFTVTTGSGIVLSGTVQAGQSGQLITMRLSITHATSRYSGGQFDIVINVAGGPQPSVIGTLIFAGVRSI